MPSPTTIERIRQLATNLRNSEDYDDFGYGTEPIPGDKTWCGKCTTCVCVDAKAAAQ